MAVAEVEEPPSGEAEDKNGRGGDEGDTYVWAFRICSRFFTIVCSSSLSPSILIIGSSRRLGIGLQLLRFGPF